MRRTVHLAAFAATAAAWGGDWNSKGGDDWEHYSAPPQQQQQAPPPAAYWNYTSPSIPSSSSTSTSSQQYAWSSNVTQVTFKTTTRVVITETVSPVGSESYSTSWAESSWAASPEVSSPPASAPEAPSTSTPPFTESGSPFPQESSPAAPEYTPSPVVTEIMTSTEAVYVTVDKTVTACSPSGTDACPGPYPPGPPSGSWSPPGYGVPPSGPSSDCSLPTSPLTNEEQVGNSLWGTTCQPTFPKWLPDEHGRPYEKAPWGDRNPKNSDPTHDADIPYSNVTRYYEFTVTRGSISADGVVRDVMLVNNQFPGPAIEANWGDMIEITVHNNISYPVEGTAIHWHGFLQRGSNWFDGVPSVSQCPIAPFHSYTYRIPAQLYGSSWYHAHYSAQYTAGIVGPIIVYGPSQQSYDIDIGPVMLSDWYHIPYFSIVSDAVGTDLSEIPPTSDSLLINGRGRFDCSKPSYGNDTEFLASHVSANLTWTCTDGAELSKFKFQPGKTHRLRLMNIGADGIQKLTIDGHQMTVISYDYVPTTPHTVDFVTLGVGQRADVLVTANNYTTKMFWMRSSAPGGPSCGGSNMGEVMAAIYYEGADTTVEPTTLRSNNDTLCENAPLNTTQPEYSITPNPQDAYVFDITLSLVLNSTGNYEWRMNNQTFRANFNYPSLMLAAEGNTSFPYDPQWQVHNMGSNKSVVLNVTNLTPFAHPFHLHGHNFHVLNVGYNGSVWDGTAVNPSNPMRRDVQIIPIAGWAALSFESDNPGVWPFHCHVAWHLSGGLAMNLVTHADQIPSIPSGTKADTCADWDYYSNNNVVDQIDAGS